MQILKQLNMDDGAFIPDSMFGAMDLDFMDELLYDGCWLETATDFSFSQPVTPTSADLNNPRQFFPSMESNSSHLSIYSHQEIHQQPTEKYFPENPPLDKPKFGELVETESHNQNAVLTSTSSVQSETFPVEGSELGRRLWIAPMANSSVRDRLMHAIGQMKDCTRDRDVLIQIWVPIKKEGRRVLTTIDQPYLLDPKCQSLASYRNVSESYQFPAEEDSKEMVGLPGRVFLKKLPECTPDVRFFRSDEYPRKFHAKQYNISGSLAVPIFEQGSRSCLGVVEVVMTTQKINYRPDLEKVCKALEAVDLSSSLDLFPPSVKACKEFCQSAVPEVSEILGSVCMTHRLPLALMWAPFFRQGKGGCQHFDEKYAHCISTVDSACFVADREFWAFYMACSEQYLLVGQGIVGKAFLTNKTCFATNISAFSKTDYPLSHHAMMFGLHAAIAIPLRSSHTGSPEFVLELFLPKDCQDAKEQKQMWDLLPISIQQACQSLHVIMDKELEDINWQMAVTSDEMVSREETQQNSPWIAGVMDTQLKGKGVCVSWDNPKEELKDKFKVTTHWDKAREVWSQKQVSMEFGQLQQNSEPKASFASGKDASSAEHHSLRSRKAGEKRRTKTEKTISLQVLRQYFAGSLKDAAKSIGVCPTTLKRICRQHGITRWPSRKIKKVGHSLKKLQLVIDSVQGAEGAIQIGSFYTAFPELTSPTSSGNGPLSSFKTNEDSKQLNPQPESSVFGVGATVSKSPSSSCSQSSGPSICCSTGAKQHIANNASSEGDALMVEDPGGVLKRTHSDAELHTLNQEEPKLLARSQSQKTFGEHPSPEALPLQPRSGAQTLQDGDGFRVKATFGADKIRLSLKPNWGFRDLQQEIVKRFNIDDACRIDLKYLDDDQEWVLLTCDADLEECKDIYRLSQSHTIKISLHQSSQQHLGSSLGSREPF